MGASALWRFASNPSPRAPEPQHHWPLATGREGILLPRETEAGAQKGGKVLLAPIFSPVARETSQFREGNEDKKMKIDKPAKRRSAVKKQRKVKWLKIVMSAVRWIGLALSLVDKHWPKLSESLRDLF